MCSPATTVSLRQRAAVRAWGLEVQCAEPLHYSSSLTAVRLPEGHSADALRATILEKYNMSLGNGLGMLKDRVFRIGHLGEFGDLQLISTLWAALRWDCAWPVCRTKRAAPEAAIDFLGREMREVGLEHRLGRGATIDAAIVARRRSVI